MLIFKWKAFLNLQTTNLDIFKIPLFSYVASLSLYWAMAIDENKKFVPFFIKNVFTEASFLIFVLLKKIDWIIVSIGETVLFWIYICSNCSKTRIYFTNASSQYPKSWTVQTCAEISFENFHFFFCIEAIEVYYISKSWTPKRGLH